MYKIMAHIGLLFVAFIWGTTFVIVQQTISLVPPFTFNAIRFLLAGMVLLPFLLRHRPAYIKQRLTPGLFIGIFLFGGYLFQTFGLLYTSSSKAGFLTGLSIVMIPLFSFLFLRQKTGILAIIGIGTATVGLFLLTADNSFSFQKGDVLVLGCAVSFAIHILINGHYAKQFHPLFLSTIQIFTVGILSSICAFLFEDWHPIFTSTLWLTPSFLFALVITACLATALAFFIQTVAQTYTSPTRVAIILAMEPVFAAITGVLVAHETLTYATITGCILILCGMIFAELPS